MIVFQLRNPETLRWEQRDGKLLIDRYRIAFINSYCNVGSNDFLTTCPNAHLRKENNPDKSYNNFHPSI